MHVCCADSLPRDDGDGSHGEDQRPATCAAWLGEYWFCSGRFFTLVQLLVPRSNHQLARSPSAMYTWENCPGPPDNLFKQAETAIKESQTRLSADYIALCHTVNTVNDFQQRSGVPALLCFPLILIVANKIHDTSHYRWLINISQWTEAWTRETNEKRENYLPRHLREAACYVGVHKYLFYWITFNTLIHRRRSSTEITMNIHHRWVEI